VATLFEVFGATRLDFDRFAREVTLPEGPCFQAVVDLFGPKSLASDGQIDRAFIGKKVFKDSQLRRALEEIIHPETWNLMLQRLKKPYPKPVTVIEIPLLFEANLQSRFERVILSFASPENQLRRLLFRDPKAKKSHAKRMIASQIPILEKIRRAQAIVDNNGSLTVAIYQTKELWDKLTGSLSPI
jgi:dephospho-CoA kinase